jgi:hypothetical protein
MAGLSDNDVDRIADVYVRLSVQHQLRLKRD